MGRILYLLDKAGPRVLKLDSEDVLIQMFFIKGEGWQVIRAARFSDWGREDICFSGGLGIKI